MAFSKVGLVVFAVLLAGMLMQSGEVRGQGCQAELTDLAISCRRYVARDEPPAAPSEECCGVVRRSDLVCICGLIKPDIERMLSMEKVVDVAKRCGKPIPSGTKCGSITVPMA